MTIMAETVTAERLEELLADDSIALVHRALWLLLWEGELPVLDLLSLDVQALDLQDREAGFSERAAGLLRELIGERKAGPVFAIRDRALTWDQAMQAAQERGHGIHTFRTAGKRRRSESG
jgi:hypothetical protein